MSQNSTSPINSYVLIDEKDKIELICIEIQEKEEFICVDLEFFPAKNSEIDNSLRSKSEKKWEVSLVQINAPNMEKIFIFDIESASLKSKTKKKDFHELKKLLSNQGLQKVFHDHRQDFWALHQTFEVDPENVFDTQIADMFLNFSSSFRSYSSLVLESLNLKIDKTCQNDDWSARPLSHTQLEYAALDVIHLLPVFRKIKEKLETLERLEWKSEYMSQVFESRKVQMNKVFQFFTKFNVCPQKYSLDFEKFLILNNLIELFENYPHVPINFLKNIA
jgi:ribonuclease D